MRDKSEELQERKNILLMLSTDIINTTSIEVDFICKVVD